MTATVWRQSQTVNPPEPGTEEPTAVRAGRGDLRDRPRRHVEPVDVICYKPVRSAPALDDSAVPASPTALRKFRIVPSPPSPSLPHNSSADFAPASDSTGSEIAGDSAPDVPVPGHSADVDEAEGVESRNIFALVLYSVVFRFAWIFKTESVIIPRFLDVIDGSSFTRGWLPVLNRVGQSVPPLVLADRLRRRPYKKLSLQKTTAVMGLLMLALAGLWLAVGEPVSGGNPLWIVATVLALYVTFFAANGMNQLALGTLHGKLVRADRRGRLMARSGIFGSILAIIVAWFLLQKWLEPPLKFPDSGFVLIFGFAGLGFLVASLFGLLLKEQADPADDSAPQPVLTAFAESWQVYRGDRSFRRTARVAMLFMTLQLLFPHFQALARECWGETQVSGFHLMLWVIVQNAAVGLFSGMSGFIADRRGNRLAIRVQAFLAVLTPLLALVLTRLDPVTGLKWYWLVFLFLGLVPVTMKSFVNYSLELADTRRHPRYVSTMSLCFAVPFVLSPVVGWMIDVFAFEPVFAGMSGVIAVGGLMTFWMPEPRHHRAPAGAEPCGSR